MRPDTRYSVQQIKFEFLSYIKEFGGDSAGWSVGVADRGPEEALAANAVDPEAEIWIAKPAVSARAAAMVEEHFTGRCRIAPAPAVVRGPDSHWVFLFRRRVDLAVANP